MVHIIEYYLLLIQIKILKLVMNFQVDLIESKVIEYSHTYEHTFIHSEVILKIVRVSKNRTEIDFFLFLNFKFFGGKLKNLSCRNFKKILIKILKLKKKKGEGKKSNLLEVMIFKSYQTAIFLKF